MSVEGPAALAAGALFFLQQPMAVAVLIAVALLSREMRPGHALAALALFVSGAAGALALHPAAWQEPAVAACLAVLGAVCAAGLQTPARTLLPAMAAAGLAAGLGGGIPAATRMEAVGTLLAAGLLLFILHLGWRFAVEGRLGPGVRQLAPRVIGAWLTAIGLLMMALRLLAE